MPTDETVWSIAWKSLGIDAIHGVGAGLTGAAALLILLRFMDWTINRRAKDHIDIIEQDAKGLALYKGMRLLACALIFGAAILSAK